MVAKGHISKKFDLVNWDVIEEPMIYLPLGTKLWVIKFSSSFYGIDRMMNNMGSRTSNLFRWCQEETKTTLRVIKWKHPDMPEAFEKEIQSLKL